MDKPFQDTVKMAVTAEAPKKTPSNNLEVLIIAAAKTKSIAMVFLHGQAESNRAGCGVTSKMVSRMGWIITPQISLGVTTFW